MAPQNCREDCAREGKEYGTLPKTVFPTLLKNLLEYDFTEAIISGFEATGICPYSVDRALSRLPPEEREVESDVQRQLIQQLSTMRYGNPQQVRAPRPSKKQKLPAGATYTCVSNEGDFTVTPAVDPDEPDEEGEGTSTGIRTGRTRPRTSSADSDSSCYSSISEAVDRIVAGLPRGGEQDSSDEEQGGSEEEQGSSEEVT